MADIKKKGDTFFLKKLVSTGNLYLYGLQKISFKILTSGGRSMDQDPVIKKYALITVLVASFTTPFMGSSINLAIPSIGREFDSSALLLSWVVSRYLLSSAAFLLPFGRLADMLGRKKIFTLGVIIFSFSSLLCGFAWSIQTLICFRILQGVGSAMTFGTGM